MSEADAKQRTPILSKDTLVPAGVVVGVASAVIGLHSYLSGQFLALRDEVREVDRRLERLEESMERAAGDRWTARDQLQWTTELARRNPTMDVPEPVPFRPR